VKYLFSALLLLFIGHPIFGKDISIFIKDEATKTPVPFAAVRLGATGQGVIADLNGAAILPENLKYDFIEISAMGYESKKVAGKPDSVIWLKAKKETLAEVVVKPDYNKIRRIINQAVNNRGQNNPEQYDWYRCHVYYKMVADANLADTSAGADTSKNAREMAAFFNDQHLLLSETYSIRTWKRPQKLQEEVIGSRFSGFKKSLITGLVTDILPFHAYSDYLALNGKDYRNPVSRGSEQWYKFNLRDEILQGSDTIWMISFFPKKPDDGLQGTVYISSRDFAIANFIGNHTDTVLGNSVHIEQQYGLVNGKWFPKELNYTFHLLQSKRKEGIGITLKGNSQIDSVSFVEEKGFHFDKVHTVKLQPAADELSEQSWSGLRPEALDSREARTYVFMDSLLEKADVEKMMPFMGKLVEAKLPIGPVDLNLERLYTYNIYEGMRPGLGAQTNDKISKHFSVGGWFAYGTKDFTWKYGAFGEIYLDPYRESMLRGGYERDIRDPGRVRLHKELDRNYLRNYLITIADRYDAWWLSYSKRFGYFQTELGARKEHVQPQYAYVWQYQDARATDYTSSELSLNVRYAFAERSAPLFGKYFSTGSKYPIVYARATYGAVDIDTRSINYMQGLLGVAWKKHLSRLGNERWQIEAGKSFSDEPLPLGKLFAGAGFRNGRYPVSIFGGLQTVYPFTFFSDAFLSWSWRHDFDWKLYRVKITEGFSSTPGIALVYNGLWGTMAHREVHQGLPFIVPENGYHEGGILLHDLLRVRYMQLYYFGLTVGYFAPLQGSWGFNSGTFVLGGSVSF
jgi:hypothetical protein